MHGCVGVGGKCMFVVVCGCPRVAYNKLFPLRGSNRQCQLITIEVSGQQLNSVQYGRAQ